MTPVFLNMQSQITAIEHLNKILTIAITILMIDIAGNNSICITGKNSKRGDDTVMTEAGIGLRKSFWVFESYQTALVTVLLRKLPPAASRSDRRRRLPSRRSHASEKHNDPPFQIRATVHHTTTYANTDHTYQS